jgi:succinate dehydrogenase / fumarate reductase cytochrome b subunit
VMDTGAGFELKTNKTFAILTFVFSILATIAFWAWLLLGK